MNYSTGDLFTAPKGVYLAHACNCMGQWGSGVALQFRKNFPNSFESYKKYCEEGAKPGDLHICPEENGYRVVCLFTSKDYGPNVDPPELIVKATRQSLAGIPKDHPVHMPMINAGLFKVPWSQTEAILAVSGLDITVWKFD